MIRITPLGWLFLILGVVLYIASLTSNSGLLLFFIGLFVGCFLLNILYARGTIQHLQVAPPRSIQVAEDEIPSEPWTVTNTSKKASGFAQLTTPTGPLARVGTIEPGESVTIRPEFAFKKRGVYGFTNCAVRSSFPFGLISLRRRFALSGEVVVYPRLREVDVPPAAAFDVMVGGRFRGQRRVLSGTHFSGVRPLQPEDPVKNIDWKSSSKGRGLMVKTFEEELSGRISVIIDTGSVSKPGILDENLRFAGSLIFSSLDAGHHIEFVDLQLGKPMIVPPFSDGMEVLDRLARLETGSGKLTPDNLEEVVRKLSARSSLVFVLTECPDEVGDYISSLRSRGRKVSCFVQGEKFSPWAVAA